MRRSVSACLLLCVGVLAAGCASTPGHYAGTDAPPLAFAAEQAVRTAEESPQVAMLRPDQLQRFRGLAGRTIPVSTIGDIVLHDGEVVLTFDDGPIPGRTDAVLKTLDEFGVKATFLMVGQMADAYPALARKVAERGHSIGTHTQNHVNLASVGEARAIDQIERGRISVADALRPAGLRPAPFFRFPYLADTAALRGYLARRSVVVIDSDIDSKDYFKVGPDAVRARTIAAVAARRSGIILFHDIHPRTVAMLPGLLSDLKARGYKVVHLAPPGGEALVASLD